MLLLVSSTMEGEVTTKLQDEQPTARPGGNRIIAGRYRIERLIAHGGMGVVYLAEQLELGRPVALKILKHHADPEGTGAFQERFGLEARTLAKLDHPNIVTLYDYGRTEDNRYYLALEYIDGPRFTDLMRDGELPPERVVRLMLQVCRALRYSHRKNVIHRDLKPSNLLTQLNDEGQEIVKVVDFGLVKVLEDDQSLTQAGLILGSPHCMAPEQVKGLDVDHRADIYAMGIMLFRALTGTWPFHGENSTATMIAHINERVPTFSAVAPHLHLSPVLEKIVVRCLAKEPEDRYPDVEALMQDLQATLGAPPAEFPSTTSQLSLSLTPSPALAPTLSEPRPRLPEDTEEATQPSEPSLARPAPAAVALQPGGRSLLLLFLLLAVVSGGGVAVWWALQAPPRSTSPSPSAIPSEPPPEPIAAPIPPPVPEGSPGEDVPSPDGAVQEVPKPPEPSGQTSSVRPPRPPPQTPPKGDATRESKAPPEKETPEGYMGLPDDL